MKRVSGVIAYFYSTVCDIHTDGPKIAAH